MNLMPRYLKIVLWSFTIIHSILWILITWIILRANPYIQLVAMVFWVLAALVWACLTVVLFFPSVQSWRLKLICLALVTPLGVPVAMGVGHYLRPLAFYLSRPAFEVVVQELQTDPESNVWKRVARGIRRVPETGQPREIAFRIGGGFPGYSHWYV